MVLESDSDKEAIIAQKPFIREFLRFHDPNNCLGLAIADFVCSTHQKAAPKTAGIREFEDMHRIGML